MYKVAVVTGSRSDYSLLYPVMRKFIQDTQVDLAIITTGCRIENTQPLTEILLADGLSIFREISSGVVDDSSASVCQAIATTIQGFSHLFTQYQPDILVVLGDRYEIFAAVQAAWVYHINVAHIAGGDVTQGAIDEAFRHSISKMSSLHFTIHQEARQRVIQLGENPNYVHCVGSPGIDNLMDCPTLHKTALSQQLGIPLSDKVYLVTLHPETLSHLDAGSEAQILVRALEQVDSRISIIVSAANADPGGEKINRLLREFCDTHENTSFVTNLGRIHYVSLLACANLMIGNSSCGLYEAPSFKLPVVNIGQRQSGRPFASNVIKCEFDTQAILESIRKCDNLDSTNCTNPFGDGHSAKRIHDITMEYLAISPMSRLGKTFTSYNLGDVS